MRQRQGAAAVLLVGALAGTACGEPAAKPRARTEPAPTKAAGRAPAPLGAREHLRYNVYYGPIEAGLVSLEVAAGATPTTRIIRVAAATSNLARSLFDARYVERVECDAHTRAPLVVHRVSREGDTTKTEDATYLAAERVVIDPKGVRRPLDPLAFDAVTAVFALRARQYGAIGSRVKLAINDLGERFDVTATVTGREAGAVKLQIEARSPDEAEPLRLAASIEEGGARRILELSATLDFGAIRVALAP